MLNYIKMVTLLILFNAYGSMANENCDTKSYATYFGKPNDQQDIGWCYAFTAADLINYKFYDKLQGQKVSPLHIALLTNANEDAEITKQGGGLATSISLALTPRSNKYPIFGKGLCTEKLDQLLIGDNQALLKKLVYKLKFLKDSFSAAQRTQQSVSFEIKLQEFKNYFNLNQLISDAQLLTVLQYSTFRSLGIEFLDLFCSKQERLYVDEFIKPISYSLGQTIYIPQKVGKSLPKSFNSGDSLITELKEFLNTTPAGINFYSGILKSNFAKSGDGDIHSAVVIGREKIKNKCHLIIRNSWGNCPDENSDYKYSKNITKCENGNIWIAEEILSQNIFSILKLAP